MCYFLQYRSEEAENEWLESKEIGEANTEKNSLHAHPWLLHA